MIIISLSEHQLAYSVSRTGGLLLIVDNEPFYQNSRNSNGTSIHWRCSKYDTYGCKARVNTKEVNGFRKVTVAPIDHTHTQKIISTKLSKKKRMEAKLAKEEKG
jgi:hypothetical protein